MAIFTLAGSLIAGAIGLGATAASLISAGLAVAANLAVSYFTRQKEQPQTAQKRVAVSQQVQFGADIPRFAVYGTYSVKGHWHYYGKWGSGDAFNGFVYKLSDGWCDGLEPVVFFYGEKHTLISATPLGSETERWKVDGYGDLIEFRFYDGRPGQVADAKLVNDTAGLERRWQTTDTMTNQAYVVVQTKFDKDKFSRGRPEFKWVLRGLRCYDWRKDGSLAGGIGLHRLADPSTWEHTNNPAILRAGFQMGVQGALSGRTLIGQGKSFAQLHLPSYTVAANVADTDRTKNARTFKTYQMGMYVDADMEHTEVLSDMDDAMAGYAFNASGLAGVIVGAPQIPAFAITEKDIRLDGARGRQPRRESDSLYNHLTGTFMSPESHWSPEPLTPVTVAADVAADKRKRSQPYDWTQIFDADVAQYLLNIRYRQGRYGGQVTLPIMPKLYRTAEAGDWCTWAGKTWLVMGKESQNGGPSLKLAETSPEAYDEEGIAVGPIVTPPTTPSAAVPPIVQNPALVPVVISGQTEVPVFEFRYTPSDDPRIDALLVEYVQVGEDNVLRERDDNVGDGVTRIAKGLTAGSQYQVRAAYLTSPPLTSIWTPWITESTATVSAAIPDNSVSFSKLALDIESILANLQRGLNDLEQVVAADAVSGSLEKLKRYTEDGELRALVSNFGDQTRALIAEESTARTSAIEAFASQALLVQAALGGADATGLMKVESSVTPDGLTASYSFLARASTDDDFEEAGIVIKVVSDGGDPPSFTSSVEVAADKFVFDDGNSPFVFEDGVLKLAVADIGTVRAGRLESPNGNSFFDLNQELLVLGAGGAGAS